MAWFSLGASGASRHLWVTPATDRGDIFNDLLTDDGRDFWDALRDSGPAGLDFPVWFQQMPETGGTTLTDFLWDTSRCGIKLVTEPLADVLTAHDDTLTRYPADVRDRQGNPVLGYNALMETVGKETPVHSDKRRSRGSSFIVGEAVHDAVKAGSFTGIRIRGLDTPFPADVPP